MNFDFSSYKPISEKVIEIPINERLSYNFDIRYERIAWLYWNDEFHAIC